MPQMEIDPDDLRNRGYQHIKVGDDTTEWSKQPVDWLGQFPSTYGSIAAPVYEALVKYYAAREKAALALADEHYRTAQSLFDAADAYERADHEMASNLLNHGRDVGDLSSPSPDGPSGGPTGPTPSGPVTPPAGPSGPGGGPPSDDTPSAPVGPNGTAPVTGTPGAQGGPGSVPPTSSEGSPTQIGAGTAAASSPTAPVGNGVLPPASVTPGPVMPGVGAGSVYSGSADGQSGPPPAGPTSDGMPVPMLSPFAAAVAANKEKEAEPAYVVGDAVNDDLVLAKTLLSSVLAAAESAIGTAWAVAVMRGPAGIGVFITSNEGRGWLPAGVFLPREVSTPWLWDEMLGADGAGSSWEGVSDPARVLVEFGLAWGPKANAKLAALASSGPIDPGLQSRLPDIAMAGLVGPAYDVDLREPTQGMTDRLGLTGSIPALEHVAQVADSQVRARCIELAADAHAQVGRSVSAPSAVTASALRQRILAMVQAGQPVSRELWDELRDADDLLAAEMLSRRVDVGRVGLGELRLDSEVSDLRAIVFERRCNELVLLLAGEPTRQSLRDAVYAHEQIVEHPLFVAVPAAVSAAEVDRPVPSVVPGAVSAPVVTAGPPNGAVVAPPTVAPPTVVPDVTSERS
ncbi:type VII secretion target [Nocardia sp. NPDC052112]|uniref:type VII secretion target n=1 Tax=Nocardia sp. NPDC052112 TaxID=3155646 RepID=UPI00342E20E6